MQTDEGPLIHEFASLCDGTYFRGRRSHLVGLRADQVCRRNGDGRHGAATPGSPARHDEPRSTRGTEGPNDLPLPLRVMMRYVMRPVVLPLFGMVHDLEQRAKRLIDGLNDDILRNGAFYASKAGGQLTGLGDRPGGDLPRPVEPDLSGQRPGSRASFHRQSRSERTALTPPLPPGGVDPVGDRPSRGYHRPGLGALADGGESGGDREARPGHPVVNL